MKEQQRGEVVVETVPEDPSRPDGATDIYLIFDGRRIAKRGKPGTLSVGATVLSHGVRSAADFSVAFDAMSKDGADALTVDVDTLTVSHRREIVDFAAAHRLPAVYGVRDFVRVGGLMSYDTSIKDIWRRAAFYVDKILKGTKPADLPVEGPVKYELIINLKTARALGFTVPPTLLARADEVIE
jgi:putative tryptophan/tyrosine transport system substrate-binding protein